MPLRADQRHYGDSFVSDERAQELADVARRHAQPWTVGPGGIEHRLGPDGQVSSLTPAKQRRELLRQAGQAPQASSLAYALDLAQRATREHYARGGALGFGINPAYGRMPGTTPLPAAPSARGMLPGGVQPVLSQNLQHGLLHHLLRQRPRFDDGGDAGNGNDGNDGNGNDGTGNGNDNDAANNAAAASGYGAGLGSLGMGPSANVGASGLGIGGYGGGVSDVASGAGGTTQGPAGGFSANSIGDTGTTMGRAASDVAGLSAGNTGFGYSGGTTATGNIGPSGIATGDGYAMGAFGGPSAGLAGFANFGSQNTADTGLTSASTNSYGPMAGFGINGFSGYTGLGASVDSDLGRFSVGQPSALGAALASAASSGDFAGESTPSPLGGFGAFSNMTGAASDPSIAGSLFGSVPAFNVAPTSYATPATAASFVGSQTLANAQQNAQMGVLGAAPATAQPSPGLGGVTAPAATAATTDNPGFSGFGDAPSLTVHADPGFAPGYQTGDDEPTELGTPQAVRNYALANLAQNFGADYGSQFGLPSNFGFSDPAAVAAVVNAAQKQESSLDPTAVNKTSLATGLGQMLGTGTWSTNNPGPYSGLAADPGADRLSAMLGFLGAQGGVDPSSLDPRAVGIDAAQGALATTPGVYNNEEAFGLAQLATNPMYASSLQALQSPNRPVVGQEAAYTSNFENPGTAEANMIARENTAESLYGLTNAQIAGLGGITAPSVTAGPTSGLGALASAPAAASPSMGTYPGSALSDVKNAYSIGAAEGYDENPVTRAAALTGWNPATYSGLESLSDDDYNAEVAKINAPSTALSDAAAMDAANAQRAAAPAASTDGWGDPDTPGTLANATFSVDGAAIDANRMPGVNNAADDNYSSAYAAALAQGLPAFAASQIAAQYSGAWGPFSAGFGTPTAASYTPSADDPQTVATDTPATGLTAADVPPRTDVTTTPGYVPGQQTALTTALNIAVGALNPIAGLINAGSGLLGGPTVGGYITNHSSPGTPVAPQGNSNAHNNPIPTAVTTYAGYGASPGTVPDMSSSSVTPPTLTAAQQAYQAALAHMTTAPAAKKANPVPLIAPTVTPASFYDPLSDPGVLAALAAVRTR